MLDSSAEHTQNKTPKMAWLLSLIIQKIEGFSTKSYTACDTCDSKKSTSLLEGARVCAREGVRVWGCNIGHKENRIALWETMQGEKK